MSINESNLKIAITNIKGIPEGIRADFNIFIYHSFTEVNLPAIKSEIAPTIDFNNLEITAIFKFFYNITICTSARYINLTRTFHSKCLMRAYIIVLITPHLQLFISIINIIEWNCQEMCSRRIPKIMDRQISGSVMRELL